jgi:hypothetical protein
MFAVAGRVRQPQQRPPRERARVVRQSAALGVRRDSVPGQGRRYSHGTHRDLHVGVPSETDPSSGSAAGTHRSTADQQRGRWCATRGAADVLRRAAVSAGPLRPAEPRLR